MIDFILSSFRATVTFIIIILIIGFKVYMKLTTGMYRGKRQLVGKTVIVTGADTGIGKETARDFARRRARVILACVDISRAYRTRDEIISSTGNKNVVVRKLDLASLSSVRDFANDIIANEERLDVLVNNAGAGGLGDVMTEDGLQLGMQVNHFGPFLLTNLLLDLLKKTSPSRIIFVSSVCHEYAKLDLDNLNFEKDFDWIQIYCCSKLSNILTANELARKLSGTGVTVNSLHPGGVHTEIIRNMPSWTLGITDFLMKQACKTAVEGAQTTIYLAVAEEVEGVTGKYFEDCKESEMTAQAKDEDLAGKLWARSEYFVKIGTK